jgi:predicted GIY-YIG superfamily endonuclease
MKFDVYVLKLSDNKWFIGKTYDIGKMYNAVLSGENSLWTQIYKPLYIHNIHYEVDDYKEEDVLMEYIDRYGIENVRGGKYEECVLSISQLKYISNIVNILKPLST